MKYAVKIATAVLIFVSAAFAGVTVSSPIAGPTVTSPVHVVANATSSNPVTTMMIYVDNVSVYKVSAAKIDTSITLSAGAHNLVVQAWDSTGLVMKTPVSITVSSTTSGSTGGSTTTIPSTAKVYSNIDQITGWASCDACAGPGGAGPAAPYSMTQNISSPSMDGKAVKFFLGGTTPYSAALWWKQLGGNSAVSNLVYDVYFYMKNPAAAQALEFDVNQSQNGSKWIFGTQCDIKDHKDWDVWDTANHVWLRTGIPCVAPEAYKWNHLVLEFQRTSDGKAKFISVTLNGVKNYINRTYNPQPSKAYELNVAFQMDGDGKMTDYETYLDKVTLYAW